MIEGANPNSLEDANHETPSADSTFPSEPFPCPACGQMLGAACRVCVACKQPVDPRQIARPEVPVALPEPQAIPPQRVQVRFPWSVFLFVLVIWFFAASVAVRFLSPGNSQIAMGGLVVLSSFWVFYDARGRGVPKPLRWSAGCLLLWIVFFPWYLGRRRTPEAACPFIEAERGPLVRALLIALLVFFLLSVVLVVLKSPPPR
jgi:hypothetical protein